MAFTVDREFKEAFDMCMEYYEVTGEELEYEKSRVRANFEEAQRCYLDIAEGMRNANAGLVKEAA